MLVRRGRRHRRPADPQLGHDRRLLRPRRPGLRLAGRADRRPRARSSCAARTASASIPARDFFIDTFTTAIEPTEVLTEIRIPRRPRTGRRLQQARAPGGRLRDGRRRRRRRARRRRPHRAAGIGLTGVVAEPRSPRPTPRRVLRRPAPSEEMYPRAGEAAAAPERAGRRRPRPRRLQAGDGRRDDRPGPPPRRRARAARTRREHDDDHPAHHVTVNGEAREADVEPRLLLVHLLRDDSA